MGCGRESRKSEIVFGLVWNRMRNLACCIWHGKELAQNAEETIDCIIYDLKQVKQLMRKENNLPPIEDEFSEKETQ